MTYLKLSNVIFFRFKYVSGRSIYTYITIFGQLLFLNGFFLLKYFRDNVTSVSSNSKIFWLSENLVLRHFVYLSRTVKFLRHYFWEDTLFITHCKIFETLFLRIFRSMMNFGAKRRALYFLLLFFNKFL